MAFDTLLSDLRGARAPTKPLSGPETGGARWSTESYHEGPGHSTLNVQSLAADGWLHVVLSQTWVALITRGFGCQ